MSPRGEGWPTRRFPDGGMRTPRFMGGCRAVSPDLILRESAGPRQGWTGERGFGNLPCVAVAVLLLLRPCARNLRGFRAESFSRHPK